MTGSMPGFLVLHCLLEFAQAHVHWVNDATHHLILCAPFSSCPQSFLESVSFPVSQLSIRWSKYWSFSFSISPFNEYSGLISLGLTGLISLLSKGLSRVFSGTTIWKHQLFSTQSSLWPNLNTYLIEINLKLFNHNLLPHSFFPTESTQTYLAILELNIGLITVMTESIKILNACLDYCERRTSIFLEF